MAHYSYWENSCMQYYIKGSIVFWKKKMKRALSQKLFGKYFNAEIFPASMGIVPVLFKKISIQQHPREKYL